MRGLGDAARKIGDRSMYQPLGTSHLVEWKARGEKGP